MLEEGELGARELWKGGGGVGVVMEGLLEGVQDVVEGGVGGGVVGGGC